jgi:arylsulfatase A-like enzyme
MNDFDMKLNDWRIAACILLLPCFGLAAEAADKPNVLFIAVDDLRPQLGCYGVKSMHTPNIDRLASQGIVFERAYCMVPTCGASRASLMSGIRPTRNRFVNYLAWAERDAPGITTLNTQFKTHGYYTISNGKVFHHPEDNSEGWSEPAWRPSGVPWYRRPENHALHEEQQKQGGRKRGPPYESAAVADDAYADGKVAEKAISDLRRLAKMDKPFFLAVGFFKPHLPFVAPKKYWDLYEREEIQLPETYHRPKGAPDEAIHTWGELRAYAGVPPKGPLSDDMAKELIHGYYACVSYTDANVGRLLDELDHLGLADNTIVVLWGDHGWNLGEHTLWCKHCCFETSMHAPLIVKAPGIEGGKKTGGLTEFIDIYPSLCELAGLPLPEHLQGRSFVPLMKNPEQKWKAAAFGRFRNGDTIRTDQYRFTEYTGAKGNFLARMLYDHAADPAEDVNVSERSDNKQVVGALSKELHEGMGKDRK